MSIFSIALLHTISTALIYCNTFTESKINVEPLNEDLDTLQKDAIDPCTKEKTGKKKNYNKLQHKGEKQSIESLKDKKKKKTRGVEKKQQIKRVEYKVLGNRFFLPLLHYSTFMKSGSRDLKLSETCKLYYFSHHRPYCRKNSLRASGGNISRGCRSNDGRRSTPQGRKRYVRLFFRCSLHLSNLQLQEFELKVTYLLSFHEENEGICKYHQL